MSFHPLFLVGTWYSIFSLMCMFCRSLFVLLFFFWPEWCLFFLRFTDSNYPFGIFNLNSSCCQLWDIWFYLSLCALVQPRDCVWVCCSIFNLLCCGLWTIVNLFVRLPLIVLLCYGPSWSWSYGSGIYNCICNHCLSPLMLVSSKLDHG